MKQTWFAVVSTLLAFGSDALPSDKRTVQDGMAGFIARIKQTGFYVEYRWAPTQRGAGVGPYPKWEEMKFGLAPNGFLYGVQTTLALQPNGGELEITAQSVFDSKITRDTYANSGFVTFSDRGIFWSDRYLQHLGYALRVPDRKRAETDPKEVWWIPECFRKFDYRVAGSELVDGADCTVLEAKGADKLWVDEKAGFVPRKREVFIAPGVLRARVLNQDLKLTAPDLWLPQLCVREDYVPERQREPVITTTTRVKHLEAGKDLKLERFKVEFAIGTVVRDATQKRSYLVTARGNEYFEKSVMELAAKRQRGFDIPWYWIAVVSVNLAIAVVLILIVIRRLRASE